jgi:uncharacterized lipoprotein YajG
MNHYPIFPKRDFLLPTLAAMLMLTGCAATQIINQWSNEARNPKFETISND